MAEIRKPTPKNAQEFRATKQYQSLKEGVRKITRNAIPFIINLSPLSTRTGKEKGKPDEIPSPQEQEKMDEKSKRRANETLEESLQLHKILNQTGGIINADITKKFYPKKTQ